MDRDTIAELFAAFGPVDVRRVFSGFGVYADDVCFALFLRDDLYLNADETTIPRFVEEGSEPFTYSTAAKTVSVKSYWRVPARLFDDPDELAVWARDAVASASRRKLAKSARKRKATKQGVGGRPAKKAQSKSGKRRATKKQAPRALAKSRKAKRAR